jgi:tetratricopeptide (TPR) repeat protein
MEPISSKGFQMDSVHSQVSRFEAENELAERHISEGNLPAAAAILVKIVEQDNSNFRAFNNLGILSWAQKAWNDAFVMFGKSAAVKPDYPDALVNLYDAALKLKRAARILPALKKAVTINPSLEEIKILADSIELQGDDVYQSERALQIGFYNPLIEEADKLLADGKLNEAMAKYLESNDTQGPSAEAYSGLGVISYYQKRYIDALTLFVESIKLNPAKPETFLNLLDAAKNCGKTDYAKQVYAIYSKELQVLEGIKADFEQAI